MDNNEKILINKDTIEKVNVKLKGLRLMTSELATKNKIDEILGILNAEFESGKVTLKELIEEKIEETKYSNRDLNFSLYMLYRKLQDGTISEEEAMKTYDLYINGHVENF